jgi:hypothetical protein
MGTSEGEARRSARIPGRFWVAIEGVDAEPVLRHGDVSATGLFFELGEDIGEVGTVQFLRLTSLDRARHLNVMAYIVRVITLADIHEERRGVALEFMPESDDAAANVVDFVRHVLASPADGTAAPHVASPRLDARLTSGADGSKVAAVAVRHLAVRTLLLEADFAVPVGDPVRIEIIAKGVRKAIRLEGEAVSVLPAPRERRVEGPGAQEEKRYRIAVRVREEIPGPLRRFSSKGIPAVDPKALTNARIPPPPESSPFEQLLSSLIHPNAEPTERHHLSGSLARIPFTTLCSLLELERLSGVLAVRRGETTHLLFVSEGRFVDLEPASSDMRAEVKKLMGARDGSFQMRVGGVDRPDRVGASMTQLLLDLARESDEASR